MKLRQPKMALCALAMVGATLNMTSCMDNNKNPFYSEYDTPHQTVPFDKIKLEHYEPAIMDHLALLVEAIVLVGILQGIGAVAARRKATNSEAAIAISARHPFEGSLVEGAIGQVAMQAYKDSLDRLQVRCVEHRARYGQRINMLTRSERQRKVSQRVTLVEVHDGIIEVDAIGCVLLEAIFELHHDFLAIHLDDRLVDLRGRYHQTAFQRSLAPHRGKHGKSRNLHR